MADFMGNYGSEFTDVQDVEQFPADEYAIQFFYKIENQWVYDKRIVSRIFDNVNWWYLFFVIKIFFYHGIAQFFYFGGFMFANKKCVYIIQQLKIV